MAKGGEIKKPVVYDSHSYRTFLRDWLAFQKASQSGFTMERFSRLAGLSPGYVSMLLSGKRDLTQEALEKLRPHLKLTEPEFAFLSHLVFLEHAQSPQGSATALDRMRRHKAYRKNHPKESEISEYLSNWYYVAIREMATLPDFKLDPKWIQSRLAAAVEVKKIRAAVEFLVMHGYIEKKKDGSVVPPQKTLDCIESVYKASLARFHEDVLRLAGHSIYSASRDARVVLGHTVALTKGQFQKISQELNRLIRSAQEIGREESDPDEVYHLEVAFFPLTHGRSSKERV